MYVCIYEVMKGIKIMAFGNSASQIGNAGVGGVGWGDGVGGLWGNFY